SAREGLDLSRINGTGAILLGGGVATLAFGIATGVVWGQARRGYENAVNVYNDSLALRLGIADADGNFKPPPGVLVDEEGFIILDQKELSVPRLQSQPPPGPEPAPTPDPITPQPIEGPAPPEPAPESADHPTPEDFQLNREVPEPGAAVGGLVGPSRGL
ncbi:MAG TPA: hypothetical protein VK034_20605, partial [Enhygromyxa sp.]|nr:hypothetical protein [Enhygromyxa sp.]